MGKLIPKINAYNWAIVVFVALGTTSVAYGLACISGALGQASFYKDMNLAGVATDPDYSHTTNFISATNGCLLAGAFLGVCINSWSADRFGRKRSLQAGAVVFVVGGALQGGAYDQAMFLIARFITGVGLGSLVTSIPMYQAELATPESRGFMVSMTGIMFAVGYTLSAWINYGTYYAGINNPDSSFPWRFPLAFQILPALIMLIGSPILPFSPRWLVQQGRFDESLKVLRRLHKVAGDNHDEYARREFIQMTKQVEFDTRLGKEIGRFALFRTPSNRKRAGIAFMVMWGAQFTGVFVIATYGVLIYTSLGMTGSIPLLLNAIWTSITIPGNIFTALFVDKFGRRTFFLIGLIGILVSLIFEAALQAQFLGTDNTAGQNAAIFFIFLFIAFWCTMMDATIYVYLSEIFPSYIRSHGQAFGMSGYFLSGIVVLVAAPIALNEIHWKFFLVLICVTAVFWLAVYFFFPETKMRSIEDINAQFGDTVVLRFAGATEAELEEYAKEIAQELELEGNSGPKPETQKVES
jgi:sugar porter (SP) family MFS transporter